MAHENSVNLIAALAMYQQRRDSAIGLAHVTAKQRGLIWYYNLKSKENLTNYTQASFYHSIIQISNTEIQRLVQDAHHNPEKAESNLKQARRLEVKIKKAHKELKRLNG